MRIYIKKIRAAERERERRKERDIDYSNSDFRQRKLAAARKHSTEL